LSVEVKIHCFWLITSKLTFPTSAYFWYGGSQIHKIIKTKWKNSRVKLLSWCVWQHLRVMALGLRISY